MKTLRTGDKVLVDGQEMEITSITDEVSPSGLPIQAVVFRDVRLDIEPPRTPRSWTKNDVQGYLKRKLSRDLFGRDDVDEIEPDGTFVKLVNFGPLTPHSADIIIRKVVGKVGTTSPRSDTQA